MNGKPMGLLLLIALTGLPLAKAQSSNLLRNSSFEEEGPQYWGVTGTALRLERGNWHPRTGRWSFGIGNDEGPEDAGGEVSQEVDLPGTAAVGRKCFFSTWLMTEAKHTGSFVMKLEFLGDGGQKLGEVARPAGAGDRQEWQLARIYGMVPTGARRAARRQ